MTDDRVTARSDGMFKTPASYLINKRIPLFGLY